MYGFRVGWPQSPILRANADFLVVGHCLRGDEHRLRSLAHQIEVRPECATQKCCSIQSHPIILKNVDVASGGEFIQHPRCFELATGLYDGLLDQLIPLFKAARVAALEVSDAYDPTVHGSMFDRFTWESCSAGELLAIPPVLVLETADRLSTSSLTGFNRVIRSGRPMHILVLNSEKSMEFRSGM